MLTDKKLKMVVRESQPYLNALEESDRTHKLLKADYKERVNFTIDADLMIKFRRFCRKESISMSNKVETLIRKYLKENKINVK